MKTTIKKILLADDEEEIRRDLALFLQCSGYEVCQATNGEEAYAYYLNNAFDLIITDIEMPKLNGLALVECIRTSDCEIPILMMSGYSDKDKLLRAIKLNLSEYLIKPFTRNSMLETIESIFVEKEKEVAEDCFCIKGHSFKFVLNEFFYENISYTLTAKQSKVLKLLLKNSNVILSPVDIYYYLNPTYDSEYSNASIRNIIKRLRSILPKGVIESIYSEGYRFNVDNLK